MMTFKHVPNKLTSADSFILIFKKQTNKELVFILKGGSHNESKSLSIIKSSVIMKQTKKRENDSTIVSVVHVNRVN